MDGSGSPIVAASTLPLRTLALDDGIEVDEVASALLLVKGCGVGLVDVTDTWLPVAELDEADVSRLRSVLDDVGLRACGVSVVRHSIIDPVHGPRNLEHTRRAIDIAVELGAGVVSIGFHEALPPAKGDAPFWALETEMGDRDDPVPLVRELARYASGKSVAIALELYEGGPLGSGRLAVEMTRRVGAANVGINLDVGNLYRSPMTDAETWLECVTTCLPVTNFWHVKNYRRIYEHPSGRHVGSIATGLSDGDIDFRRCMAEAMAVGYRGPVIVEHYGGDGMAAQRAGVRYLEEVLATI